MRRAEASRAAFRVAIALTIAACAPREKPVPKDTMSIAPSFAEPPRDSGLTCTPSVVGRNDTLRMSMALPHGPTFHIATPDGTPFIVVFHGEGDRDRGSRRSLVTPDSFARLTRLDLPVGALKAGAWVFGRDTNEHVFVQPGFYRLRVGSDMETDGPVYSECVVRLRP